MNLAKLKIPFILISAGIALFSGYRMWMLNAQDQLWGHLPLFNLLFGWIAIMMASEAIWFRHPEKNKLVLYSTISGLLLAFGFPISPLTPLMFIAFIPLLMAENIISEEGTKVQKWKIFKVAFHVFVLWNIISTFWVANTSYGPSFVAVLLNAAFMAIPFILYHVVRVKLGKRWSIFAFIAFWISFEFGHMQWEISWPWLTLGNSFAQYPSWVQWYEITGHLGGSFYILLANILIYKNLDKLKNWKSNLKTSLGLSALILVPILVSLIIYSTHSDKGETAKIVVVQPNFEPHYQKFSIPKNQQVIRFLELSEKALDQETDYLVFPETSFSLINVNKGFQLPYMRRIRAFLQNYPNLKLITGLASMREYDSMQDLKWMRTYVAGKDTIFWEAHNAAMQIDYQSQEDLDFYIKSKLVPGAEIFPYHKYLFFFKPIIQKLGGTTAGHAIQKERKVFEGGKAKVAPAICYESVYGGYVGGYIRKGANAIFIVTNDGWWDKTAGHIQHLKFASLRAIEHRRSIARSANTGISCFINQRGDILQASNYDEASTVKGEIQLNEEITFYSRFGDWIAWVALMVTLVMFGGLVLRRFQ